MHGVPWQPCGVISPGYEPVIAALADESWRDLYGSFVRDPVLHGRVDVGQLVRHYLGLRRAIVDGNIPSATLLYLFWEPADETPSAEFAAHRADLQELSDRLSDATVEFAWMSYPDLWSQWNMPGAPDWLRAHVGALCERYVFAVIS